MTPEDAAGRTWDVVVVGAGPAGAAAPWALARAGTRTLLIDRRRFPRPKVCGCCLGSLSIRALARMQALERLDACRLACVELHAAGRTFILPLQRTITVPREDLDSALVAAAACAGAQTLLGHAAELHDDGISIAGHSARLAVRAAAIIDARGPAVALAFGPGLAGEAMLVELTG